MKKKKITFLVSCLTHGGAEKVCALWINGFVERGYEVSCILTNENRPISYPIPTNVCVRSLHHVQGGKIKRTLSTIFQIRHALKELRPEILITVIHPLGLWGLIASWGLNIRIINTEHNTFDRPDYAPLSRMVKFNRNFVNRFFEKVTVLTQADIQYTNNRFKNLVHLPNPLSMKPVDNVPGKKNIILAVGRMEAWHVKGFDLLIDAWGELHREYPEWKLQILGGGDAVYRNRLIDQAKTNGTINAIDFFDFTDNPRQFFQDASIFILSSRYEGFGMVLLEAMSQGCACVACDYKGRQSEIINTPACGLCCETNSTESLKDAMKKMLDDKEYRESVRMNAIERSKEFSLDKIMNKWEEIIYGIETNE